MKVYLETRGCPSNLADGEVLAGCLERAGYLLVPRAEEAEVLVYNTCAVKTPTENRMIQTLKQIPKGRRLVVAGCLPLVNPQRLRSEIQPDAMVGPALGEGVVRVVERVLKGERVVELTKGVEPTPRTPRRPSSGPIKILKVAQGCLSRCSFCCVRVARGRLRSQPPQEVGRWVERALAEGVKEVWLTGQDLGCYGVDVGSDLPTLLNHLTQIPHPFHLRVGMMNPAHLPPLLPNLIDAYRDPRGFKFLHLPLQSGSDEVLRLMRREYTAEVFKGIVARFREAHPQLTLATDIIVGFPGEDGEAFEETVRLLEEVKPDVVNVSKFSPRPGAPGGRGVRPPVHVVKERSRRIFSLARRLALERNRGWVGWEGVVLVDEVGKGGVLIGRNFAYKPIVIHGPESLVGEEALVKVENAKATFLTGSLLSVFKEP